MKCKNKIEEKFADLKIIQHKKTKKKGTFMLPFYCQSWFH